MGLAPKEVKIKINSTLSLECVAQAFPTPALQWYKDGQVWIQHATINLNLYDFVSKQNAVKAFYKKKKHVL